MQRPHASVGPRPSRRWAKPDLLQKGSAEPLQVRIPRSVKRQFKAHAAMNGFLPTHQLFVKVWEHYQRTNA